MYEIPIRDGPLVQRRATKYILNDFTSDYKDRLISLELLPLMMFYELLDIMFFVKSLKAPKTVSIYLIIYSLQLAILGLLIFDLFIPDLLIILLDIFILTAYLDYGMLYLQST